MQISISYLLPQYEILLQITLTTLELTKLTTMNRASTRIKTMNQILLVIRLDLNATPLMMTLRTTQILKYSTTNCWSQRNWIIQVPGKPLETLRGMWKNTVICARTHGLHLLVCGVFNLLLGFIESKVSKSQINDYFSSGLGNSASVGYSSIYTLEKHLRSLDPDRSYLRWFKGKVEDDKKTFPFFYRNILDCVRYLLRQITYQDDLVYAPCHEYDQNGQRIYAEMHTADWWWDIQVQFPPSFIRTVANSV